MTSLLLRLTIRGWGVDLDFGQREEPQHEEHVVLSGGPIGFALPEPEQPCDCDEEEDE